MTQQRTKFDTYYIETDRDTLMLSRRTLISAAALGLAGVRPSFAQIYPNRPIKLIVPFAAGGPADVMARVLTQQMTGIVGQPFVLENRTGAGGTIAARYFLSMDPDGYTLMLGNTSTLAIGPAIYRNIGYDPLKNFAPIALLGTTSNVLIVPKDSPIKSVKDLIAAAKANPGKLTFASPGIGTPPHMIGELFKQKTGTDIVHVPYKGGGQAANDVVSGQIDLTFENPSVSLPLARGGLVRALAVTSETRHPEAPDVPTMIEAGVPGFVSVSFTALVAPAGIAPDIATKLNAAANASLNKPETAAALAKLAIQAKTGTPEDLRAFIASEKDKWTTVAKTANISVEN